jgi:hypothetical protein
MKHFEKPDRAAQSKKTKNKIDAEIIIKKNHRGNQSQPRYKKIAGIQHVVISEIISIVIIIKIGCQWIVQ